MNVIELLFPRQAANLKQQGAELVAKRFDSLMSEQLYYGQKWRHGLASSTPIKTIDHTRLRLQARNITLTSIQASTLVRRDVDITVDSGLVLAPEPRADVLGITPEEAERWASQVAESFELWAQSSSSSRSGILNFYQAQRLMRLYRARENECFVRHYYSQDPSLLNPLQFEIIDPDQIRGSGYTTTWGQLTLDDGIERDSQGRESAYKIWSVVPGTFQFQSVTVPKYGSKSGRVFMTHGFDPEYAGQTRGFSQLGISIQELENLLDFTSAQIKKAINQSNIYAFGESNSDKDVLDPFPGIGGGAAGARRPSDVFGSTPSAAPEGADAPPLFSLIPEAAVDTPGSMGIFNAPAKQTLKPFANTAPAESFNNFVDGYFAYIAAANGVPIEVALMRFSQNYSASRATLILAWRIACQRRYQLACDHLDPLYESWLCEEIAAGRVVASGWEDPRLRAAWLSHRWIGSSMPNIDPVASVKAAEGALKLGLTTLDDSAMEYNGSSGKSNRAKLKREYGELPLPPWATIRQPQGKESPDEGEEGEGDGK
jgi:lambda family phage portal protein